MWMLQWSQELRELTASLFELLLRYRPEVVRAEISVQDFSRIARLATAGRSLLLLLIHSVLLLLIHFKNLK